MKNVLLLFIIVFIASCEDKKFGTQKDLLERLKNFCSSWAIKHNTKDNKLLAQFVNPKTNREYEIFVRFDENPVKEIYVLWHKVWHTKEEEQAWACAFNFAITHVCGADLKETLKAHQLAEEMEKVASQGNKFSKFKRFGKCSVAFIARENSDLVFISVSP